VHHHDAEAGALIPISKKKNVLFGLVLMSSNDHLK
jgi:hypothetical protein